MYVFGTPAADRLFGVEFVGLCLIALGVAWAVGRVRERRGYVAQHAKREADRETYRSGLTHYAVELSNGDFAVATFERFTFDLPEGSHIVYIPGE